MIQRGGMGTGQWVTAMGVGMDWEELRARSTAGSRGVPGLCLEVKGVGRHQCVYASARIGGGDRREGTCC